MRGKNQISKLLEKFKALKKENVTLKKERKAWIKEKAKFLILVEKLEKKAIPKTSANSSKAPSTDISAPKKNQSLRVSSGKKQGGQKATKDII